MIKLAVLASGGGTDLQSIIDASESHEIDARIVVVISDRKNAFALERARKHSIDAYFVSTENKNREEHEKEISEIIDNYNADLIVLAGYLRMFTPYFISKYRNKIINIHPALVPFFGGKGMYGEKVHKAVLDSGMKISGCSVHFVDESIDGGPIIIQKAVRIKEDDTVETLASRVLEQEHKILPKAVQLFAEKRLRIEGKKVKVLPKPEFRN
ncbi:MAG: phosphoribosylglycinamide formyltransferase [Thermoplasmatales archaeon]|nr:phosphoribosylglycinamide formyltransferase [Thermoplasmatales archaeon]